MKRDRELEASLVERYVAIEPELSERGRRLWAGAESRAIGYGGDSVVSSATDLSRITIRAGRREIERGVEKSERLRRSGAGHPRLESKQPRLKDALERRVDPVARVNSTTVEQLLHELGYIGTQKPRRDIAPQT